MSFSHYYGVASLGLGASGFLYGLSTGLHSTSTGRVTILSRFILAGILGVVGTALPSAFLATTVAGASYTVMRAGSRFWPGILSSIESECTNGWTTRK
jgi:hypothetical protein